MDISTESIKDTIDEINALSLAHYEEVAVYQDIPLSPDYDRYLSLEENGITRLFTIRNEGALIGYALFYLSHSIQYSKSYQAVQDILYIKPEYRGAGLGKDFLLYIDNQLRKEGVQVVFHHTKVKHDFSALLKRIGYTHTDSVYSRRLDTCAAQTQSVQ